jgi:hypothetical protein
MKAPRPSPCTASPTHPRRWLSLALCQRGEAKSKDEQRCLAFSHLFSPRNSQGLRTGPWLLQQETVFVWQDWRLLSEYVRQYTSQPYQLRRSYLWGMDLVSGVYNTQMAENPAALNQAGGVGGLVWVVEYVPGQTTSHRQLAPWYDGNGNIMGCVSLVCPLVSQNALEMSK